MIPRKQITPEAARLRMASLCARGEHCQSEIREKLSRLHLPVATIGEIIEYLMENRFIDDHRYALSFTRDKIRFSGWGRRKICAALQMRRIPSDAIQDAFAEIEEEEYRAVALKYGASKMRCAKLDLTSPEDRNRLFRFLASRGFESSLIGQVISTLRATSEEES